jgi:hypothetical protein
MSALVDVNDLQALDLFAAFTGVDINVARRYLEANDWELELSVQNYYNENEGGVSQFIMAVFNK